VPRSTKTRLIQHLVYDGDFSKVRPDAVLLHGDKTGKLIEHLREKQKANPATDGIQLNGETVGIRTLELPTQEMTSNDWNKFERDAKGISDPEPKCDKRKKEYRDWLARQPQKV